MKVCEFADLRDEERLLRTAGLADDEGARAWDGDGGVTSADAVELRQPLEQLLLQRRWRLVALLLLRGVGARARKRPAALGQLVEPDPGRGERRAATVLRDVGKPLAEPAAELGEHGVGDAVSAGLAQRPGRCAGGPVD